MKNKNIFDYYAENRNKAIISEALPPVQYALSWTGKTMGVNRRLEQGKSGHIYRNPDYQAFVVGMSNAFRKQIINCKAKFTEYIDLEIMLSMRSSKDSDSPIKPLFDAIAMAGIVKNDNRIRNFSVYRKYHHHKESDCILILIDNLSDGDIEDITLQKKERTV